MTFRTFLLGFVFCLFIAVPAMAEDVEGSKDNPRVPRMPGYEIKDYQANDFGKYEFYTSANTQVPVEGRFWMIEYQLPEGGKVFGPLEIARNYQDAFKKKGGSGYDDGVDSSGGSVYAWMNEEGKETWLEVSIASGGENYILTIVEKAAMKQQVEIGAEQIAQELSSKGSIALYGINFDVDKSDIRPDSESVLKNIADALKSVPEMKVEVGGHTDNTGSAKHNQKLSEARAEAVRSALVSRFDIDGGRLTSKGYGDTKPVAGNESTEGKAKNRRVELVKIP